MAASPYSSTEECDVSIGCVRPESGIPGVERGAPRVCQVRGPLHMGIIAGSVNHMATETRWHRMTKPSAPLHPNRAPAERTEAMAALYRSGKKLHEIGDIYGVSRERVRQLLAKAGITRKDGGQSVLSAPKAAERQALSDEYWIKVSGMVRKDLLEIPASVRRAYTTHRRNAANRGIPWEMNLAQWAGIWKSSGKWKRRGRGADCYVMSRIRVNEPFSPDNVCICTLREASRFGKLLTDT